MGRVPNGTYLRVARELCLRILAPILSSPADAGERTMGISS